MLIKLQRAVIGISATEKPVEPTIRDWYVNPAHIVSVDPLPERVVDAADWCEVRYDSKRHGGAVLVKGNIREVVDLINFAFAD